jgi:CheY-like chemotaxis protein
MFLLDLRVLLAEDDRLLREFVTARLREFGCNVAEASTGEEACALLAADPELNVLVTDISMPGKVDGWSLGEWARTQNSRIAVIYTSSRGPIESRRVSGSIFVPKPYRPDELVAAIRKLTPLHLGSSAV